MSNARQGGKPRILVVDDDETSVFALRFLFGDEGFEVRTARDATSALELMSAEETDLLLSDIRMPGMSGLELLDIVRERHPETKVFLMSAEPGALAEARSRGAIGLLAKPLDFDAALGELRAALSTREVSR